MARLFSPDFDLTALGNARRGDDKAAQRRLKAADLQMTVALRLDMHRWLEYLRYDRMAMKVRAEWADGEVRKWKNDVSFSLPNFSDEKPIFPTHKTGG